MFLSFISRLRKSKWTYHTLMHTLDIRLSPYFQFSDLQSVHVCQFRLFWGWLQIKSFGPFVPDSLAIYHRVIPFTVSTEIQNIVLTSLCLGSWDLEWLQALAALCQSPIILMRAVLMTTWTRRVSSKKSQHFIFTQYLKSGCIGSELAYLAMFYTRSPSVVLWESRFLPIQLVSPDIINFPSSPNRLQVSYLT